MQPQDLLSRLRDFALSSRSPTVEIGPFLRTLAPQKVVLKEIEAELRELSNRGAFVLSAEGTMPHSVTFADFPLLALEEEYRRIAADPARLFPGEKTLRVPVPARDLVTVEARIHIGALLQGAVPDASIEEPRPPAQSPGGVAATLERAPGDDARPPAPLPGDGERPPARTPGILRLLFPENVPALVVPRSFLGAGLIEAAVERVSRYLQDPRNAAYADARLRSALRGNDMVVRQTLEDIAVRTRKAASSVMSTPTDFSVRFWSHLSNAMVADIGARPERTDTDTTFLQSALLVAYAAVNQKEAAEREKAKAADRKGLEAQVRRAPFVFTAQDLYALKDEKGVLLAGKHGREFISSFIAEKSIPLDTEILPFLVRLSDYFVQRDFLVPVFLSRLGEASDTLRTAYLKEWVEQLRDDRVPPVSRADDLFQKDVERRIGEGFPVLAAVADGHALALACQNPALPEESGVEMARCFARESTLRPFPDMLGLSRERLLRTARSYLPFWQTVPIISGIVRFFRLLFRRAAAKEPPPPSTAGTGKGTVPSVPAAEDARSAADRAAMERMRKIVQAVIAHYVPAGGTIERALEELVDRWNPLLDPGPKGDLVRDVNALAQDFIRPIRGTFLQRPPDLERIRALAEQLAASRSLAMIKNREALLRYLSLVMLRSILSQRS